MTNSIFYNSGSGRRFPIPLLAVETYSIKVQDVTTDEELIDLFVNVVAELCGVQSPETDDINYFVERLTAIRDELAREQGEAKPNKGKPTKTWGSSFTEWLSKMSLDSTVLKMCGYDFDAAKRIYCDLDRDDAMKLIKEYVTGIQQDSLLNLESAMYGFGGSYEGDKQGSSSSSSSSTATKVYDLKTPEGIAALRSMGF